MEKGSISSRLKRNLSEKNRRKSMKDLYLRLASLIHPLQSSNSSRLSEIQLSDQANIYIKQLQERIEKLQRRKEQLMGDENCTPVINMRTLESTLEINIICGSKRNFMLHQVISILEEEGAEVISTAYHNVGDRVFYTIYSQVVPWHLPQAKAKPLEEDLNTHLNPWAPYTLPWLTNLHTGYHY